ncbi:MAG: amino acid permease [Bacteroidetes bacterium MedPE-SWsnd-G1]|nr:MAG: amino acid permease [Bacteroidetes bacterium MedPE-SWsnd-G1]
MKEQDEGLKRYVGPLGLAANIINIIVGAGIFVIPAIVAEKMGATSIVAYLFCGILIGLIMLCFAEAGSKVTTTGGGFAYVEAAFGKYPGFIIAIIAITGSLLAGATVANALVDILSNSFPVFENGVVRILFFALVFFGLAFINILGIRQGIGMVKTITLLKLSPLLLLIIVGWKNVEFANLVWESAPTISEIGATSLFLIFAFQGGETGLVIGGEIKNPKKTVPKGIFIAIVTVLILYMLIQGVAQGVLGDSLANYTEAPLAEVGNVIFGPIGFSILFTGAAISMFGYFIGDLLNSPRLFFALSKDKVLPAPILEKIHPKFKTPYVAILLYATIGFLIASFGGFKTLINIASAAILLVYLGVALSVIQLRRKNKTAPEEFEIPGGITIPILACIIILYLLSHLESTQQIGILIYIVGLSIIYACIQFFNKTKN